MSVERFLAVSLLTDLPLLGLAARAAGIRSPARLALTALFACLFGLLAAAVPRPWRAPPAQLAACLALSRLLLGPGRGRLLPRLMLCMVIAAAFLAGWTMLVGSAALPALGGLALFSLSSDPIRRASARWEVDVRLVAGGGGARFTALIDTGNRLREPLSGLPVLIVEAGLLHALPPDLPCRRVAYGAVGGDGTLACFRPDAVWCLRRGRRLRAPDVWVAVSPTPLPGEHRALAPACFAALPL